MKDNQRITVTFYFKTLMCEHKHKPTFLWYEINYDPNKCFRYLNIVHELQKFNNYFIE